MGDTDKRDEHLVLGEATFKMAVPQLPSRAFSRCFYHVHQPLGQCLLLPVTGVDGLLAAGKPRG